MTTKAAVEKMPHSLPADFRQSITKNPKAQAIWDTISPVAKNEWICWVISGKKSETRGIRIDKAISKMNGGMRRPCCWVGCIHRTDKAMSASQKWVLGKQNKKK